MSNKLIEWCRHNVIPTTLIVLGVEVIVACLIWFIFGGRQTFGPLNTYVIVCLSVVIASIAALNSMFASISARDSLTATRESLELTRNTTIPFLTLSSYYVISPTQSGDANMEIELVIKNTGSLPADSVSVETSLLASDVTNGSERQLQTDGLVDGAIYFPAIEEHLHIVPTPNTVQLILDEKTTIRIIINYQHRLAKEDYETVLSYRIFRTPDGKYLFKPVPKESHWHRKG